MFAIPISLILCLQSTAYSLSLILCLQKLQLFFWKTYIHMLLFRFWRKIQVVTFAKSSSLSLSLALIDFYFHIVSSVTKAHQIKLSNTTIQMRWYLWELGRLACSSHSKITFPLYIPAPALFVASTSASCPEYLCSCDWPRYFLHFLWL